jgi:hypothetical protein
MKKRGFTYVVFLLLLVRDGGSFDAPPRAKAGAQTCLAEVGEFDRVPARSSAPRPYEPMPGIKGFYFQIKQCAGITYVRLASEKWAYQFDYKIKTADIALPDEKADSPDELVGSITMSHPANGNVAATPPLAYAPVKAKGRKRDPLFTALPIPAPAVNTAPCNHVSAGVDFEWKNFKSEPVNLPGAITEILAKCKGWQSCNSNVEIAISSPWKKRAHGDPFKPHKYWGYKPPYAVMIDRAKWIQNVMVKYGKIPADAFLPFKIDFDGAGMQKTNIRFN